MPLSSNNVLDNVSANINNVCLLDARPGARLDEQAVCLREALLVVIRRYEKNDFSHLRSATYEDLKSLLKLISLVEVSASRLEGKIAVRLPKEETLAKLGPIIGPQQNVDRMKVAESVIGESRIFANSFTQLLLERFETEEIFTDLTEIQQVEFSELRKANALYATSLEFQSKLIEFIKSYEGPKGLKEALVFNLFLLSVKLPTNIALVISPAPASAKILGATAISEVVDRLRSDQVEVALEGFKEMTSELQLHYADVIDSHEAEKKLTLFDNSVEQLTAYQQMLEELLINMEDLGLNLPQFMTKFIDKEADGLTAKDLEIFLNEWQSFISKKIITPLSKGPVKSGLRWINEVLDTEAIDRVKETFKNKESAESMLEDLDSLIAMSRSVNDQKLKSFLVSL